MSVAATDDLLREASRGDERALEKIYREYHQPLYRFCLAIVGNPQDAQDALQNTMVKMLRALPGEKRSIALKPWLYRVAHNESIDLLRRRRPDVSLEVSEPQLGEELAAQVETRQRLRQLIADLGGLPERQRETLLMREAADLSFEEIGAALKTSPAVARQTLYEARLGLRQMDAGREMKCEAVTKALSDGDGRVRRRRDIRAHLRDCADCCRFAEEIESRGNALAAISPLPAVAAAAMLQGLIGGGGTAGGTAAGAGAGGVGAGGLAGGAAVKSVGAASLLKGVAAVAVVAAIGIGSDRAGLIHVGGGNAGSQTSVGAAATDAEPAGASAGGSAVPSSTHSSRKLRASSVSPGKTASIGKEGPGRAVDPGQTASAGGATSTGPTSAGPKGSETETPVTHGASGVEHPHGRGHAKQTSAAAAHGQETAASHKPEETHGTGAPESSSGKGKSAEHPAQPTQPAAPETTSPPPVTTEPEAKSPPVKPSK